ncbi:WD repeat-containing protein 11-like isoform X2 [Daktulosphaira vitifoliae]|uniref:WD repeat-containing protein 11-like isoform X2 n=1 Tax=Daktulosphaira vitifoliae TaxID=58002 RepID=UPI0021AA2109|nr:WD repeat-containing protein 11-like isoform X2 [Daktulosphaira vitifoliae]
MKSEQSARLHLIAPRTFSNQCNIMNKGAADWSENGLLAYGAHNLVVVIDSNKVIPVQCFTYHKSAVKKLLWVPFDSDSGASSELVSADFSGDIALWDVCRGRLITWIDSEQAKPVIGLGWLPSSPHNDLLLAILHSPFTFSVFDVRKGTRLWKKTFVETINDFAFDPFHQHKIAFLCSECILLFDNFDRRTTLNGNGRKLYISNSATSESSIVTEESSRPRTRFKRLMKGLVLGESQQKVDSTLTAYECIQFTYHKALRNHILLMYQHDIIILDLDISMTVGVISIDRCLSPFIQIYSCRQRDVVFCLQESGSLSVKLRRKPIANYLNSPMDASPIAVSGNESSTDTYLWYEHKAQSEIIRQAKNSKVLGFVVCPITEKHCAVLLSTGKVMIFELEKIMSTFNDTTFYLGRHDGHKIALCNTFPSFNDNQGLIPKVRLYPRSILPSLESTLNVIKYCPPLTSTNRTKYKPLLAVGTVSGNLAIFNLATGLMMKEYHVHSHPVRGIEWICHDYLFSWSFYSYTSNTKSQVIVTDIQCGLSTPIRITKSDEPPILFIKVSPLKQYFIIGIKDEPIEIWDLKSMSMLSKMSKRFPPAVCMEWVQCHMQKGKKSSLTTPIIEENEIGSKFPESLLVSDIVGNLYAFLIDTNSFLKPGTMIEPGIVLKPNVYLTSKLNVALLADNDGVLFVWDLSNPTDKQKHHINRIDIVKLKFAPGAGNFRFLCLSSDGIDILNVFGSPQSIESISTLKVDKKLQIIDADWASSEHPVILFNDQSIRVFDLKLTKSFSSIYSYKFDELQGSPVVLDRDLCRMFQFWLTVNGTKDFNSELGFNNYELSLIKNACLFIPWNEMKLCNKLIDRAVVVCQFLGLKNEVQFWTVASYYVNLNQDSVTSIVSPLDSCYDIVCDCMTYKKMQLERVLLHEWKRGDYMHMRRVVDKFMLLGEKTKALNLLLATNVNDPNYYTDALKACLIASVDSNSNQSTIKLVATNLIADNRIDEGIQLLCMIGKGSQACRYLISYNQWELAVWLAKCSLSNDDCDTVLHSWADHLLTNRDHEGAVLVLLSLKKFNNVLKILSNSGYIYRAALLILICRQNKISIDSELEKEICEKLKRKLYINGGDDDTVQNIFNNKI